MIPERIYRKYGVGTKVFSITDDSRDEVLGDASGKRKISVRLYYPADKNGTSHMTGAQYVSDNKWEYIKRTYHIPKSLANVGEVEIYEEAPLLSGEKYPLVLFSHGYGTYVEANTFLCMELAANGYIVASIGHSFEGLCTEYADGSFTAYDKKITKKMYKKGVLKALIAQSKLLKMKGTTEEIYDAFLKFEQEHTPYVMGRLLQWSSDALCALSEVKKRMADHLDLSKGIAASGHSLGGALAYYLCQTNDEISCGLNIDGGLFGDYTGMTLTKPFFQIACRENWNVESSILLNRKAAVYCAIFENMKHIGFTDAKFLHLPKAVVGKMNPVKLHENLTKCHMYFLDKYMKGLEEEALEASDDEIKLILPEL